MKRFIAAAMLTALASMAFAQNTPQARHSLLLAQSKAKEPYCDRQCFNNCMANEPATSLTARDYCTGQCMRNIRYNAFGLPINLTPFDPRMC